jgi:branched-chain amino acid transport system substrate-binding protein
MISRDGMRLLLGPSTNAATIHDAPIAESHGVPMVAPAGLSDSLFNNGYHNFFSVLTPASQTMRWVFDMALAHWAAPHSVAIISANDSLSTELANGIRDYAATLGFNVVDFDQFPAGTNNMYAQLQAAAGTNPDLLIVAAPSGDGVTAMAAARTLDMGARLLGFTDGPQSDAFISALRATANYAVGAVQWAPSVRNPVDYFLTGSQFTSEYVMRFGHLPDWHSAAATAACLALEVAIQHAGSTDPQKVRNALAALNLQTFFGPIAFDSRGANLAKPVYVVQVEHGHPVVVWPAENANAEPRYPWPGWGK